MRNNGTISALGHSQSTKAVNVFVRPSSKISPKSDNVPLDISVQGILKPPYAFAQSDQNLRWPHKEALHLCQFKICPV